MFAGVVLMCLPPLAADQASVCNVLDYGAKSDRSTNNAGAIQKAINACTLAGGTVFFPAGDCLSGTVVLKSNVTLHLSPGATLWGSPRIEDYNPRHLISASGAENIAIEGGGVINGQGEAFWEADFKPKPRPSPLIELYDCRDVRIQDVSIRNAPAWTIHPKNCDRVKIRGISIINHMRGLNTDGIDPDSSRNVIISDCYIEAGDDCIVLKTTARGPGQVLPCENVTVTNCVLISSASALKLGTESHADFRNCVFSNCVIRRSRTGIALLAKDGGLMEGISFSSITMETSPKHGKGVEWPIVIDVEKRRADSRVSKVRDVTFSDIRILTKGRVLVAGMPASPLENLTFRNIVMRITGFEQVEGVSKLRGGTVERQPDVVDLGSTPSAFILGHARGVRLRDFKVIWDTGEPGLERHAIYGEALDDIRIEGFEGRQAVAGGQLAAILLKGARSIYMAGNRAAAGTNVFLRLSGVSESEVVSSGNDLSRARLAMAH